MIREKLKATDTVVFRNTRDMSASIQTIVIANTTSARRTVRLHHLMQGETSSVANALLYDVAVAPNSTLMITAFITMALGEELRGMADATGVSVTLYGMLVA